MLLRALAVICVGAAAITSQSFWIDEVSTAIIANQPSLADCWHAMAVDKGSSMQMPLYIAYIWGWEKLFGHAEWVLRAANLPWLALGLLALPRGQVFLLLVVILSPFTWFYVNEARPYAMQLGASLMMLGALWHLTQADNDRERSRSEGTAETLWTSAFLLGLVVVAGSSLLGVIWVAAALGSAVAVLGISKMAVLLKRHQIQMILFLAILSGLAFYYLHSLKAGAQASYGTTSASNVLFAAYEVLGLAGFGPGRGQIREQGLSAFYPYFLLLGLHVVALGIVLVAGCRSVLRRASARTLILVFAWFSGACLLLITAGVVKHVSLLGRHFTPVVSVTFALTAAGIVYLWQGSKVGKVVATGFLALSLGSSLCIRLAERHAKDDYRQAATLAQEAVAQGQVVCWSGSAMCADYYGLHFAPTNTSPGHGFAWLANSPTAEVVAAKPVPDLVVLSRPDMHDRRGAVQQFLTLRHYKLVQTLPAVTFWRKEEPASSRK
jgi:hypothetical protein